LKQNYAQLKSELSMVHLSKSRIGHFTPLKHEHRVIPINSILAIQLYFG